MIRALKILAFIAIVIFILIMALSIVFSVSNIKKKRMNDYEVLQRSLKAAEGVGDQDLALELKVRIESFEVEPELIEIEVLTEDDCILTINASSN